MPVFGITGGIASGKSTFVRELLRLRPMEFFDSDAAAHELLDRDAEVQEAIRQAFGADAVDASGRADRAYLRERVFANPEERRQLERILHPVIRDQWTSLADQSRESGDWLCVDIPLLYETGVEKSFDRVIVIACSPATQYRRLREKRGLELAMAEKIVAAQLDLQTKAARAHHVVWNDSSLACLAGQTRLLVSSLQQYYG
jgi:dephospho-CoA kinase